jgi:hypothetical protein
MIMANNDWYPVRRDEQRAMYENVLQKIDDHKTAIADFLTVERVARIKLICETYIAVYDYLQQAEARLDGFYKFQKDLEKGDEGETVVEPPDFAKLTLPAGAFKGFVTEFRSVMGLLKRQDGYTAAIGADLKIVSVKGEPISPDQKQPAFKYEARQGFRLYVTGSMQGVRAVNFYYRRKGQTEFVFVGYLTRTPGEVHIPPAQAGTPEMGEIKAIFFEDNAEVGQFSTNTEITLS